MPTPDPDPRDSYACSVAEAALAACGLGVEDVETLNGGLRSPIAKSLIQASLELALWYCPERGVQYTKALAAMRRSPGGGGSIGRVKRLDLKFPGPACSWAREYVRRADACLSFKPFEPLQVAEVYAAFEEIKTGETKCWIAPPVRGKEARHEEQLIVNDELTAAVRRMSARGVEVNSVQHLVRIITGEQKHEHDRSTG